MSKNICVYPGSFDPLTKGHLDIIRRAASLFDEVIVAVLYNPSKAGCFTVEERLQWIRKACADLANVTFDSFDGLLVEYMRQRNAKIVIRGLRGAADLESESRMAQLNHQMAPEVETLFLTTAPEFAHVSSSAVREIGSFGGDITPFVPECIVKDVANILHKL